MKKFVYLFVALFAMSVISGCSKDDDPVGPPNLNFLGGDEYVDSDAVIEVNTTFKVGIAATENVETGQKLSTLRLTRTINETAFIDTTFNINDSQYNIDFTFNSQAAGMIEVIEFTLTDKGGQTAQKSLTITYEDVAVNVNKNMGVTMGSHNDDNGSFYSTSTKQVFNITDATANQEKIDILFYLGAVNGSTIASPADTDANTVYALQEWTTKNNTLFASTDITVEAFDNIGDTYIFPEFIGTETGITQLENNSVIMFKTAENKMGLIKVNSINGRGDFINLDIIVQD